MKLAIVVTHPIRYFIPLVQLLSSRKRIELKVFFTIGEELLDTDRYDPEKRKITEPGLPLYSGYDHVFVQNTSVKKTTTSYKGIDNPTLVNDLLEWKPDAILICGWKHKSHLKVIRYFSGKIPIHFRGDSTLLDEQDKNFFQRLFRRFFLRWLYSHINKAWYVGTNNKSYFLKHGLKESQLINVPHAVDNDRFTRTAKLQHEANLIRRKRGIADDGIVFLYAGKLKEEKGIFTLLSAFTKLESKNTYLFFVGSGKDERRLKEFAMKDNRIHFLPFQSQTAMPVIYSLAEVLVLPSKSDTWGLVMNEAMANGLAIIATDKCGGATNLIEKGENGYIFNSEDELTDILQEFATNSNKTLEMGINSKQRIKAFSYDVAADTIENLLLAR